MRAQPVWDQRWRFWLILLFASVNGVLYAVLLPLWEGFDEAFHYAYVQELSNRGTLPVLGKSILSREVWDSLLSVPVYRDGVLFLTFSSQMFYAATAHIANDWLAIPLVSWLIVMAVRLYLQPALRSACGFAAVLALGLLTKSYFLSFLPLIAICLLVPVRRGLKFRLAIVVISVVTLIAGPWYARNFRLYGSVSAMPEAVAGIGLAQVLPAAPGVPWIASIGYMAKASLWTGNNQFNTFSRATLNLMLALLFIGGCYALSDLWKTRPAPAGIIVFSAVGLFSLALAYSTVVSFIYRHGASAGTSPWYMQALLGSVVKLPFQTPPSRRGSEWVTEPRA